MQAPTVNSNISQGIWKYHNIPGKPQVKAKGMLGWYTLVNIDSTQLSVIVRLVK